MTDKKAKDATNRNAQTAEAALNQQASQPALAVADAAGAGGVPAVADAAADTAGDPHAGHGGLYEIRDGQRVRLEATRRPDADPQPAQPTA